MALLRTVLHKLEAFMKNISRNYKLILALLLGFIPLKGIESHISKNLINTLKKTDIALTSWKQLQHKWLWSNQANQQKIVQSCKILEGVKEELGSLLGTLHSSNTRLSDTEYHNALTKTRTSLKQCAPPSHLKRHWLHYTLSGIGLLGGAYILFKHGYDKNENHLIKNFYTYHIKRPIKNMYDILANDGTDKTVLLQDINESRNRYENKLNLFIENAKQDSELKRLVKNNIPTIPIEQVPLKNKEYFLDATISFMHTYIPEEAINSYKKWTPLDWREPYKIQKPEIPEHLESSMTSHTLLIQQLRLLVLEKTNKVEEVSQKLDLTVELMAFIPALVSSYAFLKGISTYSSKQLQKYTYKPIKKILIQWKLQLNKERYTTTPSLYTQGMSIYWSIQLKEYIQHIPKTERVLYCNYLEQLNDETMNSEQKITIIQTMFREFTFLQKA